MRHPITFIGWPFPWRETDDLCKKTYREFVEKIAKTQDIAGFVVNTDPEEEWDHERDVAKWTWWFQVDDNPRYPVS